MEALPGLWSLSPLAALVGVLVWAFLKVSNGDYVPKSTHEREIGIYKEVLANKDATITQLTDQNGKLLTVVDTIQGVLRYADPDEDTAPLRGS